MPTTRRFEVNYGNLEANPKINLATRSKQLQNLLNANIVQTELRVFSTRLYSNIDGSRDHPSDSDNTIVNPYIPRKYNVLTYFKETDRGNYHFTAHQDCWKVIKTRMKKAKMLYGLETYKKNRVLNRR